MFDTFLGLPVHPLVVHAVVVLIPLTVLAVAIGVLRAAWRPTASTLAVIGALACAASAFVAMRSGEALAGRVGSPGEHEEWGERLFLFSLVLLAVTAAWWWTARRASAVARNGSRLATGLGWLALAVGVAAIALTVATGHSGATVTWAGRLAALEAPTVDLAEQDEGITIEQDEGITIEQVRAAAAAGSCWVIIDSTVYDLTAWVVGHPGGPLPIEALCGTDGTDAFAAQHSGQDAPTQVLAGYRIGALVTG